MATHSTARPCSETPYVTFYAFEEVPAAFKDESGSRRGLLAPNERIAYWITDQAVSSLKPENEITRKAVVELYALKPEDATKIVQNAPPRRKLPIVDTLEVIFRRLMKIKRPWQYTTFILILLLGLLLSLVTNQANQLSTSRSQISGYKTGLTDVSSDLDKLLAYFDQPGLSATNKNSRATSNLKTIRDKLTKTQIGFQ
jgi:hypothetical protein